MNNLLIQIGLYKTAEFQYVAFPNWGNVMPTKAIDHQLPQELVTEEPYHYLGLDVDIRSIDHLENLKPDNDRIKYQHLGVSSTCSKTKSYYISELFGEADGPFVDLNTLLEQHRHKKLKAVIIDIEGGEMDIFQTYSFEIQPDFFGIEAHSLLAVNFLCKLLLDNNYSLITYIPTNWDYGTRWLGFLKTELIHESAAGYCFPYLV